jgi:hypothetical protein
MNDQQGDQKTIGELSDRAAKELIKIKTVFPFTLFPTELIVDEIKVTIITRGLFTKNYFPILLKDLKTVSVWHDLFFGSLTFEISGFEQNPGIVKFLKRNEAIKAHQIIVGLTTVMKEKADKSLNDLPTDEKAEKLITIGGTSTEPTKQDTDLNPEDDVEPQKKQN